MGHRFWGFVGRQLSPVITGLHHAPLFWFGKVALAIAVAGLATGWQSVTWKRGAVLGAVTLAGALLKEYGGLPRLLRTLCLAAIFTSVVIGSRNRASSMPMMRTILVVLVATVAVLGLWRAVGGIRTRFVGVPRPSTVNEPTDPLEATSDDAVGLVDALDLLWGSTRTGGPRHKHRAVHTTGTFVVGEYAPASGAASGSVVGRFSNFSGSTRRADVQRSPRGAAFRITEGDGSWDVVLVDVPRFPVATRDDFYGFVFAFGRLRRLLAFIVAGRSTFSAALSLVRPLAPRSYLTRRYYSVNTFLDDRQPVRLLLTPPRRFSWSGIVPGDRATRLDRDLRQRLAPDRPAEFRLWRLSGRGLPVGLQYDARRAWPVWGRKSLIGTITLSCVDDSSGWRSTIGFNPHNLPDGWAPSRDEILMARRAAYAESYLRRCPFQ